MPGKFKIQISKNKIKKSLSSNLKTLQKKFSKRRNSTQLVLNFDHFKSDASVEKSPHLFEN